MTGKLARLLVGTCMTAALTVSGLAGSMPAAHAAAQPKPGGGGGAPCQIEIGVNFLKCFKIVNNIPVVVVIAGNNVELVSIENVLNANNTFVNIANGAVILSGNTVNAANDIEVNILNVLNNFHISCTQVNVTVGSSKNDNC